MLIFRVILLSLMCVRVLEGIAAPQSSQSVMHQLLQLKTSGRLSHIEAQLTALEHEGFIWGTDFHVFWCLDGTAGGFTVSGKAAICAKASGWFEVEDEIYFAGFLSVMSPTHFISEADKSIEALFHRIGSVGFSAGLKVMIVLGPTDYVHGSYTGYGVELAEGLGGEFSIYTQNQSYQSDASISVCSQCHMMMYGGISFGSIVSVRASGLGQMIKEAVVGKTTGFSPLAFHVLPYREIVPLLKRSFTRE